MIPLPRPGALYQRLLAATDPVIVPARDRRFRAAHAADPEAARTRRAEALTRAIGWFEGQERVEVSALWLLGFLHRAGIEPRLAFVEEAIARYRDTEPGFRQRLFDPDYPYDPTEDPFGERYLTEDTWQVFEHPVDTRMRRCLFADRLGLGPEFLEELASLEDGGGYGTTHITVGGRLLMQFGLIPDEAIRAVMAETAPRVAAANRTARCGDLFIERVVVLQWLEREDLIDPAWIERAVSAQLPDGGWPGRLSLRRATGNQHSTALGITLLAQDLTGRHVPARLHDWRPEAPVLKEKTA